jgi:hypothetical protein
VLPRIANIKDADRPHKIELWPADIDVRAVLNELECEVSGNEVFIGIRGAPSGLNLLTKASEVARWKRLAQSSTVGLKERFIDTACAD